MTIKKSSFIVLPFCMTGISALMAQPSISDLADQINQVNKEQLSDIESRMIGQIKQLEQIPESGMMGCTTMNVTNVLVK